MDKNRCSAAPIHVSPSQSRSARGIFPGVGVSRNTAEGSNRQGTTAWSLGLIREEACLWHASVTVATC
jgi:hypothetical protein